MIESPPPTAWTRDDQQVRRLLETFLSYRPVTGSSGVEKVVQHAASTLLAAGFQIERVACSSGTVTRVSHRPPGTPVTVGIAIHCDVVDATVPDQWTLVERDGRYYCRGAADMLGALAELLLLLPHVAAALNVAIDVILTPNEEKGPRAFGEYAKTARLDYAVLWTPEPTGGRISLQSRGQWNPALHFQGIAAHGSRPSEGVNAIDLFCEFRRQAARLRFLRPLSRMPWLRPTVRIPVLHPKSPYREDATLTPTVIKGGQSFSLLADTTEVEIDCRFTAREDPAKIRQQVEDLANRFNRRLRAGVTQRISIASMGIDPDSIGVAVRDGEWLMPISVPRRHPAIVALSQAVSGIWLPAGGLYTAQAGGTELGLAADHVRSRAFEWGPGRDQHRRTESVGIDELRLFGVSVFEWLWRLSSAYGA